MGWGPFDFRKYSKGTLINAAVGAVFGAVAVTGIGYAVNNPEKFTGVTNAFNSVSAMFGQTPAPQTPVEIPETDKAPVRYDIVGGYGYAAPAPVTLENGSVYQAPVPSVDYLAAVSVTGCTADLTLARLSFQIGIIEDPLRLALIQRSGEAMYQQNRVAELSWLMADLWKQAAAKLPANGAENAGAVRPGDLLGFDMTDTAQADALKDFLDLASIRIMESTGVRVALKVSVRGGVAAGMDVPQNAHSTCRVEGTPSVPEPMPLPRDPTVNLNAPRF